MPWQERLYKARIISLIGGLEKIKFLQRVGLEGRNAWVVFLSEILSRPVIVHRCSQINPSLHGKGNKEFQ